MPEAVKGFNESQLSEQERKDFAFVTSRIVELQESRENHYGVNLDTLWAEADRDYVPHRLKSKVREWLPRMKIRAGVVLWLH